MSVDNSHPYDIRMSETCCFTKQCIPVFKTGSTIEHLVAESTLKTPNYSVGNRERIILK